MCIMVWCVRVSRIGLMCIMVGAFGFRRVGFDVQHGLVCLGFAEWA
jgi:hypothetical protein